MDVGVTTKARAWRRRDFETVERSLPEESAVAISVNGSTHAVMMATPSHMEEMAIGLMLNERIITGVRDIERLDIAAVELGFECRLWLAPEIAASYVARKRQMAGPVGCGLCGVESLELATVLLPRVEDALSLEPGDIVAAMASMATRQVLGKDTRAVHAAGFHRPGGECIVVREDIGRHNALDKVTGHLARQGVAAASGFLTMTSRLSVELVQKSAMMGTGLIAAISVPSALAVRQAEVAGITLIAVARGEDFEIFTHPHRITGALRR